MGLTRYRNKRQCGGAADRSPGSRSRVPAGVWWAVLALS